MRIKKNITKGLLVDSIPKFSELTSKKLLEDSKENY